jgi:hypothetical protein
MTQFGLTAMKIASLELAQTSAFLSDALYPLAAAASLDGAQMSEHQTWLGVRTPFAMIPSMRADAIIPVPMKPMLCAIVKDFYI